VNSGRDLASTGILGGLSSAVQKMVNTQNNGSKNGATSGTQSSAAGAAASTGTAGKQDNAVQGASSLSQQIQ
jgi:hypothetical protein